LPQIDQFIDSTAGCDLLCFLDCYSGYHQIAIKEEDQEKTAFVVWTSLGPLPRWVPVLTTRWAPRTT
jgi:hypothetical protein